MMALHAPARCVCCPSHLRQCAWRQQADAVLAAACLCRDDYQKTFELGSKDSTKRKQYDADSAWFWADGANTSAITGHFLDIAREVRGRAECCSNASTCAASRLHACC